MIRRIELRKYTPEKFKINLLVTRNLVLGKIYGWISQLNGGEYDFNCCNDNIK